MRMITFALVRPQALPVPSTPTRALKAGDVGEVEIQGGGTFSNTVLEAE